MRITFIILSASLIISCSPMYLPNSRNAPMFSGKGEIQCTATLGTGNNLQAAYAITDHIGVMANGMNIDNRDYGKHNYGEIGIGYYRNLEKRYVDVFGGYGEGNMDVHNDGGPKSMVNQEWFKGSFQKYFIQPGLAFKLNESRLVNFHLGVVYRFSLLDFSRVSVLSGYQLSSATPIQFNKTQLFHEPSFILKIVLKQFYFTAQGGLNLTFDRIDNSYYCPVQLSVGGGLRFNLKKKKEL